MRKSQLIFLCDRLGDPNLGANEKWKCIKYIYVENPIADVQKLLKRREIMYVDNPDIGAGFYILGYSNSDLGVPKRNDRVVTFIPLKLIDKISIVTTIDIENDGTDNENNIIVDSEGDTLILSNIDVETYEDIIIINNVKVETDGDTLVINSLN